jgi:hypothetical protein
MEGFEARPIERIELPNSNSFRAKNFERKIKSTKIKSASAAATLQSPKPA